MLLTGAQLGTLDAGHIGPDPPPPAFSGSTGYFGFYSNGIRGLKALDAGNVCILNGRSSATVPSIPRQQSLMDMCMWPRTTERYTL